MTFDFLEKREYILDELSIYWPFGRKIISDLPIAAIGSSNSEPGNPPECRLVNLPEWATDLGVAGQLLSPEFLISPGVLPEWQRTDWFKVAFWYLHCVAERAHEVKHGPIHSYSFRLKGWDTRLWERAWVNRIALFLRRWAAQRGNKDEMSLFGPLPVPEIVITHDLDAVYKTVAIRCKQTAFYSFNSVKFLLRGNLSGFLKNAAAAVRFFFSGAEYNQLQTMADIEENCNLRSYINVYGGPGGWRRAPSQILFDPGYSIRDEKLIAQLRSLAQKGWTIGLHQSFHAWDDAKTTGAELLRLSEALRLPITACRQHWLRFGWGKTWKVQAEAGLKMDMTLGFNDRPGFRNAAALRFHPYDEDTRERMNIQALPLVLMDSHLYDYGEFDAGGRSQEINRWLEEIRAVRGTASVLWHPHTLGEDYGWLHGLLYLISRMPYAST